MDHLISAGLAIDAINNTLNGDYKMAVFEGILSAGVQVSKYFARKKQKRTKDFQDKVPNGYVPKLNVFNQGLKPYSK